MKVSELIAKLQTLPQDLEVIKVTSPNCCCGDCFLPYDEENDVYDADVGKTQHDGKTVVTV